VGLKSVGGEVNFLNLIALQAGMHGGKEFEPLFTGLGRWRDCLYLQGLIL
jgi:hypothetical protein